MENVIDLDMLDEQTFQDAVIRREVIGMFLDQAPAISSALAATSGQARADIAHRLKGSALALGATALAAAASRLEEQPDVPQSLTETSHALDATLQALRHLSA